MTQPGISDEAVTRRSLIGAGLALWAWAASGCQTGAVSDASEDALPAPIRPGPYPDRPLPVPADTGLVVVAAYPVIPRSAWTAAGVARPGLINPMGGIRRITVHHEGAAAFTATAQPECARRLEAIRRGHLGRTTNGQPWADIGYHYIVDPAGRVWEGRSTQHQGAHVHLHNEHNLGVMVLGNFDKQHPAPAALATLNRFIAEQMRVHRVPASAVYTHQELNKTACPGRTLQGHMAAARARGGVLRT